MKFYLEYLRHLNRLPRRTASTAGFSLIEILLAAMLMLFVFMIAGIGLVNLLRNNYKTNAESEIQNNLNRTIEFVSDEVRRAKVIAKDESEIVISTAVNTQIGTSGHAVLAFQIPNPTSPSQAIDQQIIYYTKPPAANESWIGPRVLWRYGPNFDENGNYLTPNNTSSWIHTPLVDMLVASPDVRDKDCDPYRDSETPDNNRSNDPVDWTLIPEDDDDVDGFFVCVKDDGGDDANLVMLRASAEVPLTSYTNGQQDKARYSVDTKIYTRSVGQLPFYFTSDPSGGITIPPVIPPLISDPPDDDPYRVILEEDVTVTGSGCPTGTVCTISVQDPSGNNGSDRYTVNLNSTVSGRAGDEIRVYAGGVASISGNVPTIQSVELYSYGQPLPSGTNISLQENQVLYVLTNLLRNTTYNVVVTINPR